MTFTTWLSTFVSEKEIDTSHILEVEGENWGMNLISVAVLIEHINAASSAEQQGIKHMLVKLDFLNQPILPYFKHLAQAIAL